MCCLSLRGFLIYILDVCHLKCDFILHAFVFFCLCPYSKALVLFFLFNLIKFFPKLSESSDIVSFLVVQSHSSASHASQENPPCPTLFVAKLAPNCSEKELTEVFLRSVLYSMLLLPAFLFSVISVV